MAVRTLQLTVPAEFVLPGALVDCSPASTAAALRIAAVVTEASTDALRLQHVGECAEQLRLLERRYDELQAANAKLQLVAPTLAAPLIEQAVAAQTRLHDDAVRDLRLSLENERARSEGDSSLRQEVRNLAQRCSDEFAHIRGSTRCKGRIGEASVVQQMSVLCPDAVVEGRGDDEDHVGDGMWVRHFGTANLTMRCMFEVKNVSRVRAEEVAKFHGVFERMYEAGEANCALFVSIQTAALPLQQGCVKHSPYCMLDWKHGAPVMYLSGLNSNPDLLSVGMAVLQHVWQYCDRVGALGNGVQQRPSDEVLRSMIQVVNNFINEQYALHHSELQSAAQSDALLRKLLRDNDRRRALHQKQVDNIANRIATSLGSWTKLREIGPAEKKRAAAAIPAEDLTEDQRRVVDACLRHTQAGGKLRSVLVNGGEIDGVRKYDVDSLFGTFGTLRKTVELAAAAS